MNKSLICVAVLAGVVTPLTSQASFEMVLAVDFTNSLVRRFDGETGASFGTFGGGRMSRASAITINQSLGHAYVYDRQAGRIFTFNYNTGEYLNDFSVAAKPFGWISTASNGDILLGSSESSFGPSILSRYTNTGTFVSFWQTYSGQASFGLAEGSDGGIYTIDGNGKFALRYASTSGGSYTDFLGNSQFSSNGGEVRAHGNRIYAATGSSGKVVSFTAGTLTIGPTYSFNLQLGSELDGLGFGHGNTMYVCGMDASANGKVIRYSLSTGVSTVIASVPGTTLSSMAVVVAPEPSSLLAFGIAGVALMRRRRSQPQ